MASSLPLPNKRRLVLTIYRSLMRLCHDIPPRVPLDDFIPPMRDTVMDDVGVFKRVLKEEFRAPVLTEEEQKQRIQRGLDGMRQLTKVHPDLLKFTKQWGDRMRNAKSPKQKQRRANTLDVMKEQEWIQERIDSIRWLPRLEESPPHSLEVDADSKFPLFPLQSTLFHPDVLYNEPDTPLPLFTPQSETPIPGGEIPLKIFEPRYRQLYSDLMMKAAHQRNLVVPFCHPTIPGKYAQHGLLYQVTQLQEVADETSGKIQYLANHVVTKPVQILRILNPQVWETKETYLQVQGRVLDDRDDMDPTVLEPLRQFLLDWKRETAHPLAQRSLVALDAEGFWSLVDVWAKHLSQELFQLQLGIVTQVKRQAGVGDIMNVVATSNPTANITPEIVSLAQKPHRKRLLQLMLGTSLLMPTLLSLDGVGKCNHMISVMKVERKQI